MTFYLKGKFGSKTERNCSKQKSFFRRDGDGRNSYNDVSFAHFADGGFINSANILFFPNFPYFCGLLFLLLYIKVHSDSCIIVPLLNIYHRRYLEFNSY